MHYPHANLTGKLLTTYSMYHCRLWTDSVNIADIRFMMQQKEAGRPQPHNNDIWNLYLPHEWKCLAVLGLMLFVLRMWFNWNTDDLAAAALSCFVKTWDCCEMSMCSHTSSAHSNSHQTVCTWWWQYCVLVFSGIYGPDEGWASVYPECRERNQSPINIVDQDTKVSSDYQELTLEGFDTESSNKTSMKNTGKTGTTHSSCAK